MMKAFVIIFCLSFVLLLGVVVNVSAQEVPNYEDKYVNDFANILNSSQVLELRTLFSSVDENTTAEIVFVSLGTINGEDISQYSFAIGDQWKVGKADKDNGLVILYVKETGKIWVSTGYGLEGILPDSKVGRLLDETYVPLIDSGNVSEGIVSFSNAVAQVIYENREEVLSGQAGGNTESGNFYFSGYFIWIVLIIVWEIMYKILAPSKSWWLGGVLGGVFGAVIGFFFLASVSSAVFLALFGMSFGLLFDYIVSKRYLPQKHKNRSGPWWIPIFFPSGGGSSGGGGGGFGGGGFGGGGAGR